MYLLADLYMYSRGWSEAVQENVAGDLVTDA